jgi:hypothetical protein
VHGFPREISVSVFLIYVNDAETVFISLHYCDNHSVFLQRVLKEA